jgi:hypothetical protein
LGIDLFPPLCHGKQNLLQIEFWTWSIGFRYVFAGHSPSKRHTNAAAFPIQMLLSERENADFGF